MRLSCRKEEVHLYLFVDPHTTQVHDGEPISAAHRFKKPVAFTIAVTRELGIGFALSFRDINSVAHAKAQSQQQDTVIFVFSCRVSQPQLVVVARRSKRHCHPHGDTYPLCEHWLADPVRE